MVHAKVLRDDITTNMSLETMLNRTVDLLKVAGRPLDPFLVCTGPRTLLFQNKSLLSCGFDFGYFLLISKISALRHRMLFPPTHPLVQFDARVRQQKRHTVSDPDDAIDMTRRIFGLKQGWTVYVCTF